MATPLGEQIALVTGGGRGIGRTLALGLAQAGADVAVVARTKVEVDAVAEAIRELGRRALAVTANIESRAGAQRAVDECAQHLGPPGVLVNAAAVQGPIGRFDTLDLDAWAYTVRVDLLGMAFVTHAVLQHMVAMRRGKIVNLSGGGSASPRPRFSAYASSKAAVVRLTETLAEELLEANVQVNAVEPGATWTRMTEEVLEAGATADDDRLPPRFSEVPILVAGEEKTVSGEAQERMRRDYYEVRGWDRAGRPSESLMRSLRIGGWTK